MPSELKVILDEINYEFDILDKYNNHYYTKINKYSNEFNNLDYFEKSLDYINMYNMHVTNLLIYLRALRDKLNDST